MTSTRVYGLAQCDRCRKARNWLTRFGIEHEFIDYRTQPIDGGTLEAWSRAVGWDAMINRASTTWRQLPPLRRQAASDAEWILLLRDHPALLKRPVTATEGREPVFGFSDALFKRLFVA